MDTFDPIVEVVELAFGLRFRVHNSVLSKIVRELNAYFITHDIMSAKKYKEIINNNIDELYALGTSVCDELCGFKKRSDGREIFGARICWIPNINGEYDYKAIGELTYRRLDPLSLDFE